MRRAPWITATLAALLLCAGIARADIPRIITFQGRLSDLSGTPLAGTHTLSFSLYDATTGGTTCFSETQSAVPINNGLFKVSIGGATSGGITTCDFSKAYYLQIQVDTDNPMTPRLALSAAPYAFAADMVGGRHASGYQQKDGSGNVTVSGKLGVGVASPTQSVDVNGYVKGTQLCIAGTCKTAFVNGTVTSLSASTGITLSQSPLTTAGSISVNTSTIQQRVTGTCGAGQIIKSMASNGTVACTTLPTSTLCTYSTTTRKYSPGAFCYTGSASGTYCTSGKYQYTKNYCNTNGTWTVSSASCDFLPPSC
jgi:hypothetical protein